MKNLIIVFLFISSLSFSQDIYTFKSGGRVFENEKKINTTQIESYFGHKPEIMQLYKAGRTKKTVGNVFLYSGIGIVVGKFLTPKTNSTPQTISGDVNNTMYVVGAGLVIIAIPIKIGFQRKIKKSILLMNEEIKSQKQNSGFNLDTDIIANANGVGLKFTF